MQLLKKLFAYYLLMIAIFTTGRLALFLWQYERLTPSDAPLWQSFLYGLKMDTMVASMLLVIPLIVLSFSPRGWQTVSKVFLRLYFVVVLGFLLYMENATFPFLISMMYDPILNL